MLSAVSRPMIQSVRSSPNFSCILTLDPHFFFGCPLGYTCPCSPVRALAVQHVFDSGSWQAWGTVHSGLLVLSALFRLEPVSQADTRRVDRRVNGGHYYLFYPFGFLFSCIFNRFCSEYIGLGVQKAPSLTGCFFENGFLLFIWNFL